MDDFELMRIRADLLFTYDQRGRMLRDNEPEGDPAPLIFVGSTSGGMILRFSDALSDDVAQRLRALIERQPAGIDLRVSQAIMARVRSEIAQRTPLKEGGGPAYRFPESIPEFGEVTRITSANAELVRDTFPWLYRTIADKQPCAAIVRNGHAISVCNSSRVGPDACEAGLRTLPDFQGQGYAAAATAAWGAFVRESGRIPLYSTSWDNLASQGVARRVGLIMFGSDMSWISAASLP